MRGAGFFVSAGIVSLAIVAGYFANAEPAQTASSRAALQSALDNYEVIRLHVIANSDSDEDQSLKLYVRDAILESFAGTLSASSPEDARGIVSSSLQAIQERAESAVAERGCTNTIQTTFTQEYFPDREYAGMVVPGGMYDSLVIRIGEALGRNWWCVMYPPLCLLTPDMLAAADAARPDSAIASGVNPVSNPSVQVILPNSVAQLAPPPDPRSLSLRTLPQTRRSSINQAAALTEPAAQPMFESIILRWFRALASN